MEVQKKVYSCNKQLQTPTMCQVQRNEHNRKCLSSWHLALEGRQTSRIHAVGQVTIHATMKNRVERRMLGNTWRRALQTEAKDGAKGLGAGRCQPARRSM